MKKIRILHISKIDNDKAKGTSVAVPEYVLSQFYDNKLAVGSLNCNNIRVEKLKKIKDCYIWKDNKKMSVISKFKPDIVVFHELYKIEYIKIYKYLINNNIPYIIIPHGGMSINVQNTRKLKKYVGNILLFNSFFKKAHYIQYLSEAEKEKSVYKKLNYYVIGNGISDIPKENEYLKNYRENKSLNLIYVGRYDYLVKGLDQLILAMKIIKDKKIIGIHLDLYGKSTKHNEEAIKMSIDKYELKDYISLHGTIYGDEKRKIILERDAFIQVSRTEGQPLGVMEALSLGMPVILSIGTGYKEIIKENNIGFLTDTKDKEIAEAIIKMKNNMGKLKEYSTNAYYYAIDHYTWKENVKKTIEMYKNVIK